MRAEWGGNHTSCGCWRQRHHSRRRDSRCNLNPMRMLTSCGQSQGHIGIAGGDVPYKERGKDDDRKRGGEGGVKVKKRGESMFKQG